MTDSDYLIYGISVTALVFLLNFLAFFILPVVLRQLLKTRYGQGNQQISS